MKIISSLIFLIFVLSFVFSPLQTNHIDSSLQNHVLIACTPIEACGKPTLPTEPDDFHYESI